MKITSITVHAARTFNHPYEQYSNLRPEISLQADLEAGDDPVAAGRALQQQAETLIEEHKRGMLKSIRELHEMTTAQRELARLGDVLRENQERVEELRRRFPGAEQLSLDADEELTSELHPTP